MNERTRTTMALAQIAACFTPAGRARDPDLVFLASELQRKVGLEKLPTSYEPVHVAEMATAYVAKLRRPPSSGPVPDVSSITMTSERAAQLYEERIRHPRRAA